jgi:hypothetical protein
MFVYILFSFHSYDATPAALWKVWAHSGPMLMMGEVRDWAPPGWRWEVLSSGARTLVRNPGPVVDPDLLWWRSRGPRSVLRGPAPEEVVSRRIREEDEHV